MKITRIDAIPYAIPYRKTLRFASGEVSVAEHVLVRIHTDAGITGIADAPPRPYTYGETQKSIIAVIDGVFAPALVGTDPLARSVAARSLYATIGNPTAKGAIDVALWDILAKSTGLTVTTLLGGFADSMDVSHMLGFQPAAKLLDEALAMRERYGIRTFKIKVGRHPISVDVEACHVLREGLGDETELYMDANRGWSANEALEVLRQTDGLGLSLLEEPCDARELLSRKRLVEKSPIPIVADESVPGIGEVARELLNGGANAVSIKTARTGFTESQKILGLCEGIGVDVVMGNQIDTQLGTMATVAFGAAHYTTTRRAGELSNFLDMSDDLLLNPIQIADGRIRVRDAPGYGVEIDEAKLAYYRQDIPREVTHAVFGQDDRLDTVVSAG